MTKILFFLSQNLRSLKDYKIKNMVKELTIVYSSFLTHPGEEKATALWEGTRE